MTDRFRARCHVYWFWTPSAALWDFEQFKLILLNINVKLISGFITSIWWTSQDEECVNVHALRPVIQQGIFQPKRKNVICVWIFSPLHLVSPLINVFLQQIKRSLCIVLLIPCFPKMFVGQTVSFWEVTMHWWELSNNLSLSQWCYI